MNIWIWYEDVKFSAVTYDISQYLWHPLVLSEFSSNQCRHHLDMLAYCWSGLSRVKIPCLHSYASKLNLMEYFKNNFWNSKYIKKNQLKNIRFSIHCKQDAFQSFLFFLLNFSGLSAIILKKSIYFQLCVYFAKALTI